MREEFRYMAELPGTPPEQAWVREYLETLSEWESDILTASVTRCSPASAKEAVSHLLALHSGSVYLVKGGYEGLGERLLRSMGKSLPDDVLEYIDLRSMGMEFEDRNPGYFVGNRYAAYPPESAMTAYQGRDSPLPRDTGWSVKLKLASPAAPEGVWLRLPDYQSIDHEDGSDGEIAVAKDALRVESLNECTLLDARCVLPEAGNLQGQYASIEDLVFDGNNLGFILDERGQGAAHWLERFAAALEYEGCHTLRFALDISQNLDCYEWVSCENLKEFAANHLRSCGVSEELITSGAIHMKSYAEDLLETSGYMLTGDESAYVTRNTRTFSYNYSMEAEIPATPEGVPAQKGSALPENILSAFPQLCELADVASPEEAASANAAIREALASQGPDGLRQLQAVMEYEECDSLEDAAAIAAHLNCYSFVDIHDFCEATKAELLSKGVDKRALCCFDYETYAALTHDFGFIHTSDAAGVYLCRTDDSFQLPKWQEQDEMQGPTM